ncbi:MAG: restriction endonuclease subunit S [Bacteroidota bacterium]
METTEMIEMQQPENEIKEGYKKTKIGFIPNGWECKKIKNVAPLQRGFDLPSHSIVDGKFPVVYSNGILRKHHEFKVTAPGVVTGRSGTIGKVTFVEEDYWPHNTSLWVTNFNNNNPKFIYYQYTLIDLTRFKAGSGVPTLNRNDVHDFYVPVPPLSEQKKIAEILSTWDVAIEQTQKLLEQLKLRKKGLMQQLLTGKTRLKGFNGEWKYLKGGELFSNHSNKNHDGTLTVLSATQDKGVIPRDETGIDIKYDRNSLKSYKKIEVGDFVISLRSFQGGIEYSNYEGLVSPAYTVLKETKPISKVFYKEYLKTDSFITRLNSIIYGIRDGKQISYKEFATLKIACPKPEEQNAIAKVLTAADDEIKAQENYLQHLQTQKKGLMQKLLTGEIRVNVDEAN